MKSSLTGIELIAAERERQITVEGWTPEHDAEHDDGQLACAAAAYAIDAAGYIPAPGCLLQGMCPPKDLWPFEPDWWKPSNDHPDGEIRSLVKAGALIAAEVDRRLRLENSDLTASPTTEWKQCTCMISTDKKLQEQGFQLARGLYAFQMPDLAVIYQLPLERTDGKKLRAADPKTISMSHCPFCGKSFKAPAAPEN